MFLRNNAPGPRTFNVKGGAPGIVIPRTLAPGEAADLDLLVGPDLDKALEYWLKTKEIEEVGADYAEVNVGEAFVKAVEAQAEADQKVVEAAKHRATVQAAELDQARLTPPRNFASDGGPQQSNTVDGRGGALTPSQEEHGRREPPSQALPDAVSSPAKAPEPPKAEASSVKAHVKK